MRRLAATVVAGIASSALAGCGSDSTDAGSGGTAGSTASGSAASSLSGDITVLAAASLTDSFTTLGQQFEAAHPGVTVTSNFGASSALATQITSGAPADVFASASAKNMDAVVGRRCGRRPDGVREERHGDRRAAGEPRQVTGVNDLARPGVKMALCQPQVPVWCDGHEGLRQRQGHGAAGHAGARRQGGAEQGPARRGRRRHRLRHRRAWRRVTRSRASRSPADVNASTSYPIAALTKAPNADRGGRLRRLRPVRRRAQAVLAAGGLRSSRDAAP